MCFDGGLVDGEAGGDGCGVKQRLCQAPHNPGAAWPAKDAKQIELSAGMVQILQIGPNMATIVLLGSRTSCSVGDDTQMTSSADAPGISRPITGWLGLDIRF